MLFKRSGILALLVAGALAVPAAASAQAPPLPTIEIGATVGHVGPDGASVTVPVTYSCVTPDTFFASMSVTVDQWSGKKHAEGTGGAQTGTSPGDLVCDGSSQTINVELRDTGNAPFKQGKASVMAEITVASYSDGSFTVKTGAQPLTLKKK